jgi:hypothetical protein
MTMPSDMVVAPLTLRHKVDVVCAEPPDDDDEPGCALPMDIPAIALEPLAEAEDACFAAGVVSGAACDEASDTAVAANTRTAAMPTAVRPVHHSRAARLSADQLSVTACLIRCIRSSSSTSSSSSSLRNHRHLQM